MNSDMVNVHNIFKIKNVKSGCDIQNLPGLASVLSVTVQSCVYLHTETKKQY